MEWRQPIFSRNYTGDLDLNMIKWLEVHLMWDDMDAEYCIFLEYRTIGAHDSWINAVIRYAAKNGQLDIVQYLYGHRLHDSNGAPLYDAALSGHFEVVKWLHEQNPAYSRAGIEYAAQSGHFEIVKLLHNRIKGTEHDKPGLDVFCEYSIDKAAWCGSLEMVQWLHQTRTEECSPNAMNNAATKGHLAILQYLHANRSEGCTAEALGSAVYNGHLKVVQWLLDHRPECSDSISTDTMDLAAKQGHIVKWLHENRSEGCTTDAVDDAAAGGHLEVVKFLIENRSEGCTSGAVSNTAMGGYFTIVQYILASRFASWSTWAMDNAYGHYEIVRWLHKNRFEGCTKQGINDAARAGHVLVVKYLHEHFRFRVSESTMKDVGQRKQFAVLEWVMEHDPNFANYRYESANKAERARNHRPRREIVYRDY